MGKKAPRVRLGSDYNVPGRSVTICCQCGGGRGGGQPCPTQVASLHLCPAPQGPNSPCCSLSCARHMYWAAKGTLTPGRRGWRGARKPSGPACWRLWPVIPPRPPFDPPPRLALPLRKAVTTIHWTNRWEKQSNGRRIALTIRFSEENKGKDNRFGSEKD